MKNKYRGYAINIKTKETHRLSYYPTWKEAYHEAERIASLIGWTKEMYCIEVKTRKED